VLNIGTVFTTDSFVVQPFEFPGGNIGDLAVHGTVNDLAVAGARPLWLSLALILEEGLPLTDLRRVLDSLKHAADDCGVTVVTGDTKVVARGQADGIYINTAGIGAALEGFSLSPDNMMPGDRVLVSGSVGDHGAAVLTAREGIDLVNGPDSDSAPVHRLVLAVQHLGSAVRFMRDPTRGGLASVLNELVEERDIDIVLSEATIPVSKRTNAVTEILGLDVLHLASEGRMLLVCAADAEERILDVWHNMQEGAGAATIGVVKKSDGGCGRLILDTRAGGRRLVDSPRGELLPRIC
jgi:hydrogenase expression/formation protein HypE